jgi:hypothetical protein
VICVKNKHPIGREHAMHAYNLFRRKGADALYCAVPEDFCVPPFVIAPRWEFKGRLDDRKKEPFGFDRKAAASGTRFNGFYLFPDFQRDGP